MTGSGLGWRERYADLRALPTTSSRAEKQRRGKEFERVLYDMFAEADMDPRSAYKPAGEEIDGSFLYHGRTMLFEAKWTNEPIPASTLYQFRGKVEGKLTGTLGVVISMGGYSKDAVDALVAGKSLNLILFDKNDMDKLAQLHCIDIGRALSLKLRAAAESGTPYSPLPPCDREKRPGLVSRQVIVVEGSYDAAIIGALHQVYGRRLSKVPPPVVVVAMGRLNLPLVALAQLSLYPDVERIIIVADGGRAPAEVRREIQDALGGAALPPDAEFLTIVINPTLETALGIARRPASQARLAEQLRRANPPERLVNNSDLRQLFEILGLMS